MNAPASFLFPVLDPKCLEPIGTESLLVSALTKARETASIGPLFVGVTARTRQACERELQKFKAPVEIVSLDAGGNLAKFGAAELVVRAFLPALRVMKTDWLVGPCPPHSSFFDPPAFQFSLAKAASDKHAFVVTGVFTAWQAVLIHRSMLSKAEGWIGAAGTDRTDSLEREIDSQIRPHIPDYRTHLFGILGQRFNPKRFMGHFEMGAPAVLDMYRKVAAAAAGPLSALDFPKLWNVVETRPILKNYKPKSLWIEISAVNDVPPVYSPVQRWKKPDRIPAYMPLDIFSRIYDLAAADKLALHLTGLGEILQHPEFGRILEILNSDPRPKADKPPVHCYTDGRNLTESVAADLLNGPVRSVMVSLDAVDESHYLKVRPTGDFHRVKNNLDRLIELKREKARRLPDSWVTPILAFTTTLISELEDHLDAFMTSHMSLHRYLMNLGKNPSNEAKTAAKRTYYQEGHVVEHLVIQGASTYAGQNPDRRLAVYTPLKRFACRRLTHSLFIKTDGSLVLCDRVFAPDAGETLANIRDIGSLRECWDRLEEKRAAHEEGRYEAASARCGSCEDWITPVD